MNLNRVLFLVRFIFKCLRRNIRTNGFVKLQHNVSIIVEPSGQLTFGKNSVLKHDSVIYVKAGADLVIGDNFSIGHHAEISVGKSIQIGDDVIMAPYTYITDSNHSYTDVNTVIRKQGMNHIPVKVGSNIWMGRSSMILPGADIKSNSVVAAGAIVTSQIEFDNVVLAGVPAKVIKRL